MVVPLSDVPRAIALPDNQWFILQQGLGLIGSASGALGGPCCKCKLSHNRLWSLMYKMPQRVSSRVECITGQMCWIAAPECMSVCLA